MITEYARIKLLLTLLLYTYLSISNDHVLNDEVRKKKFLKIINAF